MVKVQKHRNIYLDLFKFFLAFLVITVHTVGYPFNNLNRLGVIMFFMITGYFTYSSDQSKQLKKAKQLVLRSFIYMMIGFAVYFLYDMYKVARHEITFDGWLGVFKAPKTYIKFFAFSSPPYYVHLWYLIAFFFVSIYHYIFVKLKITSAYKWIVIFILFLVGILYYAVYPSLPKFDIMYLRNSYLMGFPAFATGFILKKKRAIFTFPNYSNLIIGTTFFFLQVVGAVISPKEYYYCSFISSIFLIIYFTNLECKNHKAEEWYYTWIGKSATFYIYVFHWLVMQRLDLWKNIQLPVVKPLLVLVVSFLLYEVLFLLFKFIVFLFSKTDKNTKEKEPINDNVISKEQIEQQI